MKKKYKLIYLTSGKLSPNDYRIMYSKYSNVAEIIFGMPGKTRTLNKDFYFKTSIGEGFKLSYFSGLYKLYKYFKHNKSNIDCIHFYSTNYILFGPLIEFKNLNYSFIFSSYFFNS